MGQEGRKGNSEQQEGLGCTERWEEDVANVSPVEKVCALCGRDAPL